MIFVGNPVIFLDPLKLLYCFGSDYFVRGVETPNSKKNLRLLFGIFTELYRVGS